MASNEEDGLGGDQTASRPCTNAQGNASTQESSGAMTSVDEQQPQWRRSAPWPCAAGCVLVEATVVSGLESMAREEIMEKLQLQADISRGRVCFAIASERLPEIFQLQSVDNFYVVVHRAARVDFVRDEQQDLLLLYQLVADIDWTSGIDAWKRLRAPERDLDGIFACKGQTAEGISPDLLQNLPRFRVTCNRSGKEHKFTSMQAAAKFGAAINDLFHWKVDMKGFDIHVVLNVSPQQLDVLVALTSASLHHRNLIDFGPTSLRSTIAYNMLRLARVRTGEVICDPLCGGGSIPIEAARNFPLSFVLTADKHELAIPRCRNNLEHNRPNTNKTELLTWDSTFLPLRGGLIDVIVTDLPFGKRLGCKSDNRVLYPQLLRAFAHATTAGSARAVLLTQDKRSLIQALHHTSRWWRHGYTASCNVGGLDAAIFVCHRTQVKY